MKTLYAITLLLSALLTSSAFAQGTRSQNVNLNDVESLVSQSQHNRAIGEIALAPLRSESDVKAYLRANPTTPFDAFGPMSLTRFIDSLTFNSVGLTSFRTIEMEQELSPRQAYAILSLFGVQKSIAQLRFENATSEESAAQTRIAPIIMDDYPGYRCMPPATCLAAHGMICIGQNCGGGIP